jgi:hypothetical protein
VSPETGEGFVAQKICLPDRRYGGAASDWRISRSCPIGSQVSQDAMLKNGPPTWDANHDGVYTCDEWKSFVDRIFTSADRNRDGHLDSSEFETVRKADATLADADFGYFDENQDGKITRKEFVEKPSAFILRFDKNGDCRVTADEIRAGTAPKPSGGPVERPRDRFH